MTVLQKVGEEILDGSINMITEGEPAPCAIYNTEKYLRYGCCLPCARVTPTDDPRLEGYPRIGGKDVPISPEAC